MKTLLKLVRFTWAILLFAMAWPIVKSIDLIVGDDTYGEPWDDGKDTLTSNEKKP